MTCFHWFARAGAIVCGVALLATPAQVQGQIIRDAAQGVGEFGRDAVDTTGDVARDTVRGAERAVEGTARGVRRGVRDADNRVGRGPVRDTARAVTGGVVRGTRRGLGLAFDERAVNEIAVGNIESGSVAYRAGLRQGDRIVSINDREFDSYDKANVYLDGYTGNDLDFVVQRDGRELEFTANLPATRRIDDQPSLGVTFDEETDDLVVTRVERDSPAHRAGIRTGDQLVSLDDRRLTSYRQVRRILADVDRDEPISIGFLRDGRRVYLEANLAARREAETRVARRTERRADREPVYREASRPSLGVVFDQRDDELIVSRVERNSPAYHAGLRRGDLIVSLDGRRVNNFREVTRYLSRLDTDDNVDIGIWRDGRDISLDARLSASEDVYGRGSRERDTADRDSGRRDERYAEERASYDRDSADDDRDYRREARRDADRRFDGRDDESSSRDDEASDREGSEREKSSDRRDKAKEDKDSDDRDEEDKEDREKGDKDDDKDAEKEDSSSDKEH